MDDRAEAFQHDNFKYRFHTKALLAAVGSNIMQYVMQHKNTNEINPQGIHKHLEVALEAAFMEGWSERQQIAFYDAIGADVEKGPGTTGLMHYGDYVRNQAGKASREVDSAAHHEHPDEA